MQLWIKKRKDAGSLEAWERANYYVDAYSHVYQALLGEPYQEEGSGKDSKEGE
jgi:hypothetical protein